MALFGLSPLFLSLIASAFFTNPQSGLDVTHFLNFLSIFVGLIHLIGAFNLRLPPHSNPQPTPTQIEDLEQIAEVDECSPLLPGKPPTCSSQDKEDDSALGLLHDRYFWILTLILVAIIGSVSPVDPFVVRRAHLSFHSARWSCLIWGLLCSPYPLPRLYPTLGYHRQI
jgi:hypothetical protein